MPREPASLPRMNDPEIHQAAPARTALTIAGSDPTGGAGLQADLQVFRSLGVHGMGVLTAMTVQDSEKVHQVLPAFPSVVLDQLRALLRDVTPNAVKIGMLATDDILRNVLLGLGELSLDQGGHAVPVVIDPVLNASDGSFLLERRAWPALRGMCQRAALVTPNLPEAEILCETDTSTRRGAEAAARAMVEEMGAHAALVKGGHREADCDDVLAIEADAGTQIHWLEGQRVDVGRVHGTGCALSSAITARMALGDDVLTAVNAGRSFVALGIAGSVSLGRGARFLGAH